MSSITGASGGMGTATMQLAKLAGATVIATTRHPGKPRSSSARAPTRVVDTSRDDAARRHPRAYAAAKASTPAVDYTGATELMRLVHRRLAGSAARSVRSAASFRDARLRVVDMVSKELNVHGIRGATRNDQRVVAELLEKGRIAMPIHAVLPLAKVAQAHAMLEDEQRPRRPRSCCIRGMTESPASSVTWPARGAAAHRARPRRRGRYGRPRSRRRRRGIRQLAARAALGA